MTEETETENNNNAYQEVAVKLTGTPSHCQHIINFLFKILKKLLTNFETHVSIVLNQVPRGLKVSRDLFKWKNRGTEGAKSPEQKPEFSRRTGSCKEL